MQSWMVALSLGIAATAGLPQLLTLATLLALGLLGLVLCLLLQRTRYRRYASLLLLLILGLGYGHYHGQQLLAQRLPLSHENQTISLEGQVVGLPKQTLRYGQSVQRFELQILHSHDQQGQPFAKQALALKKVQLHWYGGPAIIPGQRWLLSAELRQPRGLSNPAGFDYQSWLLQQGIDAQGKVLNNDDNQLLGHNRYSLDYWRWRIVQFLDKRLQGLDHSGLIKALLVADKRGVSSSQWQLLSDTGTLHLWVISGLHIGILAVIGFYGGRLLALLLQPYHVVRYSCLSASLFAGVYAAAAGFSLPTQRAAVMVWMFMLAMLCARHLTLFYRFNLALLLCLLLDPLAVISPSFYLSFVAVAAILLCCGNRYHAQTSGLGLKKILQQPWLRAQWAVFIALTPILLLLFKQAPLLAVLVNFIAIPLFSLLLIPGLLLAALLSLFDQGLLSGLLWQGLDVMLAQFMVGLRWLQAHAAVLTPADDSGLGYILLLAASLLLLLPKALPGRWLACLLCLPLWYSPTISKPDSHFTVLVFDVGQGLSVLVNSHDKYLLFDVGAAWPEGSMANSVLLPYFRAQGIKAIDALVISHGDNDHAGGLPEVLQQLTVKQFYKGEALPSYNGGYNTGYNADYSQLGQRCQQQRWQWYGVAFEFMSGDSGPATGSNNASCVLKISNRYHSLLLTGDIERAREQQLVARYGDQLNAELLLAPHHGSLSSSSWPFIKRVQPKVVIYSSGYHNRFMHPSTQVVQRYQ
ncbi:DNA internalization-related competence protein ComEC/Rec2 [Dasania marina]|uniref:DNA internalization-related competence protein ComEC/Rec2 n=1 Tax=Dasania marina TaxID=471499 RepID=UPI0030DA38E7|tara:strand:+ start:141242 stop:143491 length:2250 start_codon:yes stop_codon:yes gene_type:complete